jgi:uncharacterized protein YkwD
LTYPHANRGLRALSSLSLLFTVAILAPVSGVSAQTTYVQAPRYVAARPVVASAPTTYTRTVVPTSYSVATAVPSAPAAAPAATAGDFGFTSWLNGVRAQYGLAPVGFDPSLASWASMNNAQQAGRGLGHFIMGPSRRQNCAVGNSGSIGWQWMNSPAHRATLLDPTIRWIGLAGSGMYWTLNAR